MKVVLLVPALMLDNNRKANHTAMSYAIEHYPVDEIIVNDAEFREDDYREGFHYIGHHRERQGFVKTRNQLLEYFYNSDADYAIWMDANGRVSKPTLSDFVTIVEALKSNKIEPDVLFSTLGIIISQERMTAKKMPDYFDKAFIVDFEKGYEWMHGLVIKNFKKYYGITPYIDDRCDPRKLAPEDIYFTRLLKKLFNCKLMPGVVITKPNNKTSTWVADKKGYDYPKVDYTVIDKYVRDNLSKFESHRKQLVPCTIALDRLESYKEFLKPYKPRGKKPNVGLLDNLTNASS